MKHQTKSNCLKASDLHRRSLFIDGPHSEGYVGVMVDVWDLVSRDYKAVISDWRFDLASLENKETNFLWFRFSEGDTFYDLPLDLVFAKHLPRSLIGALIQPLGRLHLNMRNKAIVNQLEAQYNSDKPVYRDLKLFDELRHIEAELKQVTESKLKNGASLLQKLNIPITARFEWLVIQRILAEPEHEAHSTALGLLRLSYFKGNVAAFDQNLNQILTHLDGLGEQLSGRMGSVETQKKKAGSDHEDLQMATEAEVRYWLQLQRMPFNEIRRNWGHYRYREKMQKLKEEAVSQHSAEKLAGLVQDLRTKIVDCLEIDGQVFSNLQAEYEFEIRTQSDMLQAQNWLEDNTIRLMEVMKDCLLECRARKQGSLLVFPDEFDRPISKRIKEPQSAIRSLERVYEQLCGPLMDSPMRRVEDLVRSLDIAQNTIKGLMPDHLANWAGETAILGEEQRFDFYRERYKQLHRLTTLRQGLSKQLEEWFLELETLSKIPIDTLETCLSALCYQNIKRIRVLNLEGMDSNSLKNQFEKIGLIDDARERLVRLYVLNRRISELPSGEVLDSLLNAWRSDLSHGDFREYKGYIDENRSQLEEIKEHALREARELVLAVPDMPKRIRWELLGVWRNSYEDISRVFTKALGGIPRIGSLREGKTRSDLLSRLSSRNLDAQDFSRSGEKDKKRLEHIPGLLQAGEQAIHQFRKELAENARQLRKLKPNIDQTHHHARSVLARFGAPSDIAHLKLSLNIDDIEAIMRNFKLRKDCSQEDIQLFGDAFRNRKQTSDEVLVGMKDDPRVVLGTDGSPQKISADFKLELLLSNEKYASAEILLIQRLLNFASSTTISRTRTVTNILELFQVSKRKDGADKHELRKLYELLTIALSQYRPVNFRLNYEVNCKTFFKLLDAMKARRNR